MVLCIYRLIVRVQIQKHIYLTDMTLWEILKNLKNTNHYFHFQYFSLWFLFWYGARRWIKNINLKNVHLYKYVARFEKTILQVMVSDELRVYFGRDKYIVIENVPKKFTSSGIIIGDYFIYVMSCTEKATFYKIHINNCTIDSQKHQLKYEDGVAKYGPYKVDFNTMV
jgi:hypothetical protein